MQQDDSFDKEFRALVAQIDDTIASKYGTDNVVERSLLKQYMKVYEKTLPNEHHIYFTDIYNKNKDKIITDRYDDAWAKKCIEIKFGSFRVDKPDIEEKKKKYKILYSNVYNMACKLRDNAEKKELEVGIENLTVEERKDLIRPSILTLHTLRIFYYLVVDQGEKLVLEDNITKLEIELGVSESKRTKKPDVVVAMPNDAITSIFNMATDLMKGMGMKIPDNIKAPTAEALSATIKNLVTDDNMKQLTENMVKSLGTADVPSMLSQFKDVVSDPKIMESIKGNSDDVPNILSQIKNVINTANNNTNNNTTITDTPQNFVPEFNE